MRKNVQKKSIIICIWMNLVALSNNVFILT